MTTVLDATGSRLDTWWERRMAHPVTQRLWHWGAPLAVLLIAAFARLWNLGTPHELVFDETYYVKDAYTLMHLGYEGAWPGTPNPQFNAGITDTFTTSPSFVAHPPLGKWIIAIGLAIYGAGNSFGWRVSVAVCGILLVALVMLVAWLLFRSRLLMVIAGGLIAIDGEAIVLSRVALLDTMVSLFALAGVTAILLDRRTSERRLAGWIAQREAGGRTIDWGPTLWARPWLIAAGVAFGCSAAVKWSGIYFIAVFAVYALVSEMLLRRRMGVAFWLGGTVLKQGPATFLLTIPIAAVVYVASWTGWFATDGGYYRHWASQAAGTAWTGLVSWVPLDVQSWWHYQVGMYNYSINEHSPHPYAANPLTWLLMVRPTSMYWSANDAQGTAATILGVANPLIWWAATAACVFLLVRLIRGWITKRPVWREGFILAGMAGGYLPWLLYTGRTVFQFYTIAFEPYMILALTAAIGLLIGRRTDPEGRRANGLAIVTVFGIACVALSLFFFPVWSGMTIPRWLVTAHFWFSTWV